MKRFLATKTDTEDISFFFGGGPVLEMLGDFVDDHQFEEIKK